MRPASTGVMNRDFGPMTEFWVMAISVGKYVSGLTPTPDERN